MNQTSKSSFSTLSSISVMRSKTQAPEALRQAFEARVSPQIRIVFESDSRLPPRGTCTTRLLTNSVGESLRLAYAGDEAMLTPARPKTRHVAFRSALNDYSLL